MKDFIGNALVVAGCALIIYAAARFNTTLAYLLGGVLALVVGINLSRSEK